MNLKDTINIKLSGVLEVTRVLKDGTKETVSKNNLVLEKSREVLRNLVLGESETITKLGMGNANIPREQSMIRDSIPSPLHSDIALVNKTIDLEINSKEKTEYQGRPAIKYSFYMDFNDGNSPDGQEVNFFTEAGLMLADETLFTRLTFTALTKDNTSSLSFDYYLIF